MIRLYESIAALRKFTIDSRILGHGLDSRHENLSWYGGETDKDVLKKTETGDISLVPEAERLIDQLDTAIETPRRVWERGPVGAFCVVPDVLAGLPTPMRYQREDGNEHSPITILASMNSSASVSAAILRERGTVILALTMALARVRPVTLHSLFLGDGQGGETVFTAQINTTPLDLATACYVLSSAGFYRRMCFGVAEKIGRFTGGWPTKFNLFDETRRNGYFRYLAEKLTSNPDQTLVISPAGGYDKLITEPVEWLNAQIRRFTTFQEDAQNG